MELSLNCHRSRKVFTKIFFQAQLSNGTKSINPLGPMLIYTYIGDSSACCRLVAWEKDIDSLVNRLYARLNGMQLTSKAEIDQLHMMSIFTKLFSKDLNHQGIK